MITTKDNFPKFTPEEYFVWEEQQNCRHEYIDGEVYAMTGDTVNHSKIASNVNFLLKSHLRGGGCQVLASDARVNIVRSTDYVYPDVSVTCDERDKTTSQFITHPCLIVEILSPNTEAYGVQIKKDGHAASDIVVSKLMPGSGFGVIPEVKTF